MSKTVLKKNKVLPLKNKKKAIKRLKRLKRRYRSYKKIKRKNRTYLRYNKNLAPKLQKQLKARDRTKLYNQKVRNLIEIQDYPKEFTDCFTQFLEQETFFLLSNNVIQKVDITQEQSQEQSTVLQHVQTLYLKNLAKKSKIEIKKFVNILRINLFNGLSKIFDNTQSSIQQAFKIVFLKINTSFNNIFLAATTVNEIFRVGFSVGRTHITGRKKKTRPIAIQRTATLMAKALQALNVTFVRIHFTKRYRISKTYYSILKSLYSRNIGITQFLLLIQRAHGYGVKTRKPRRV